MTLDTITWVALSWYVIPIVITVITLAGSLCFDLYYHGSIYGKGNRSLFSLIVLAFVPVLNIVIMSVGILRLAEYCRDL